MPWCTTCDRFLSPSTVRRDGTCPSCGRAVDPGRARLAPAAEDPVRPAEGVLAADGVDTVDTVDEQLPPIPWHLKLLAGATAVYLGYRFLQGLEWVADRF